MTKVIGVRFRTAGKIYYFDPARFDIKKGDHVNLERALSVGSRLGGHIVSGHIDGVGSIAGFQKEDNAVWITVNAPFTILRYIIEKGSIAIDGVSLTVAYVDNHCFKVSVIPHTGEETGLLKKQPGDTVNLENDLIGKYVEKLLLHPANEEKPASTLTMEKLGEYGFL